MRKLSCTPHFFSEKNKYFLPSISEGSSFFNYLSRRPSQVAFSELVYMRLKRNHKAGILQLSKNFRANYFSNFSLSQSRESFFYLIKCFVEAFALLSGPRGACHCISLFCRRNSMGGSFSCLLVAKHLCKCAKLRKSHFLGQKMWVFRLQVWSQADFKCKGMNGGWQSFPPPSLCHYFRTWPSNPTPYTFRN